MKCADRLVPACKYRGFSILPWQRNGQFSANREGNYRKSVASSNLRKKLHTENEAMGTAGTREESHPQVPRGGRTTRSSDSANQAARSSQELILSGKFDTYTRSSVLTRVGRAGAGTYGPSRELLRAISALMLSDPGPENATSRGGYGQGRAGNSDRPGGHPAMVRTGQGLQEAR